MKNKILTMLFICIITLIFIYSKPSIKSKTTNKHDNNMLFNTKIKNDYDQQISNFINLSNKAYIAVGYKGNKDMSDIWIAKFNKKGKLIWDKTYGKQGWNRATAVLHTKDNGFIIIGEKITKNSIGRMVRVLKLDEKGELKWQKYFNFGDDNEINDIIQLKTGEFIITGALFFQKKRSSYLWILKINQKGNIIWNKTYGGNTWDSGHSIIQTYDTNLVIAGTIDTKKNGLKDIWLLKINQKGEKIWEKTYGNINWDSPHSLIQTTKSNLLIAGYSYLPHTKKSSAWILYLNKQGKIIWHRTYGGSNWDDANTIIEDQSHFLFAGYTKPGQEKKKEAWFVKLNQKGDIIWQRTYGDIHDDEICCITKASNKGYILGGYTISPEAEVQDAWLFQTDNNGYKMTNTQQNKKEHPRTFSVKWDKTYGSEYNEQILDMTKTRDHGYICVGFKETKRKNKKGFIIKVNKRGFIQWSKIIGERKDSQFNSIKELNNGSYIAAGYTYSKGKGESDVWVVKINRKGRKIWERTFGGKQIDKAKSLYITKDGFIIAGFTASKGKGGSDIWIIKCNKRGKRIWDKTFGGHADDEAVAIRQTKDKGFIMAGHTYSQGEGQSDIWILKLTQKGQLIWEKTLGYQYHDGIYDIKETKRHGFIMTGYTYTRLGRSDLLVIKLSTSGQLLWYQTYNRSLVDTGYTIDQLDNGSYITAGTSFTKGVGNWDIWIIKLDKKGDMKWNRTYGGEGKETVSRILQNKKNEYILAGSTTSKGTGLSDFLLLKFKEKKGINKFYIKTKPNKANIYINNKLKGLSPLEISIKTQAVYQLKIEKADHYIITNSLILDNKNIDRFFYQLQPKTGTLICISHYSNIQLLIDKKKKVMINENKIYQEKLNQGKHIIQFKNNNNQKIEKTIYIINNVTNIFILNEAFFKSNSSFSNHTPSLK